MSTPWIDTAKLTRWRSTASTWANKANALMQHYAGDARPEARYVVGYEAERLASDLLTVVELLIPLLNDDDEMHIEFLRRDARGIDRALRNKALAPKLANTAGRTAEEARTFAAKARELKR